MVGPPEVKMVIKIDISAIKGTNWRDLLVRFGFGGLVTAAAGIIAKEFGPTVGGLFLAFPAIFPASATLIEKHEQQRKQRAGMSGVVRAREAVALDAAGASMGSLALLCFAFLVERLIGSWRPFLVVITATAVWMLVSFCLWLIRKKLV